MTMQRSEQDEWMLRLSDAFYQELETRFRFFVDMLFPANARGQRVPILMEVITDPKMEWMALEEIARRSLAVKQGLLEADSQTQQFDQNVDNAQQRLVELRAEFSDGGTVTPSQALMERTAPKKTIVRKHAVYDENHHLKEWTVVEGKKRTTTRVLTRTAAGKPQDIETETEGD